MQRFVQHILTLTLGAWVGLQAVSMADAHAQGRAGMSQRLRPRVWTATPRADCTVALRGPEQADINLVYLPATGSPCPQLALRKPSGGAVDQEPLMLVFHVHQPIALDWSDPTWAPNLAGQPWPTTLPGDGSTYLYLLARFNVDAGRRWVLIGTSAAQVPHPHAEGAK